MAELKAIKISKETYAELNVIAGELQIKLRRPVSIEEVMKYLIAQRRKGATADLAGCLKVSDEDVKRVKASMPGESGDLNRCRRADRPSQKKEKKT